MNTKIQGTICGQVQGSFRRYVERELDAASAQATEQHLQACDACREQFQQQQQVISMLAQAYNGKKISQDFDNHADRKLMQLHRNGALAPASAAISADDDAFLAAAAEHNDGFAGSMRERLSSAPWWLVSVVMHFLVVVLASLISMSINLPKPEDALVTVTELAPMPKVAPAEEKKQTALASALETTKEIPPTDPTSKEESIVFVPPDILARAELGDHFETINLDRPDTASAFGVENSQIFYMEKGNADAAGGGGDGGSTLEDVVGVGGPGSRGSGGGWGGGDGTGIGLGKGPGTGGFGSRSGGGRKFMVKKHGGSPATEGAVEKALAWLARHQEKEGHWAAEKYADNVIGARHGSNGVGTVKANTVGVSGLALLAFLGAGHSLKVGIYKENVKRAVEYLVKNQQADGHLAGHGCSISSSYSHHIATLALAEAYGMSSPKSSSYEDEGKGGNPDLKAAIEKALELIYKWQDANPQGAWSYPEMGPIDPTVSGWAVMALKSAKVAGFKVPTERMLKALEGVKTICSIDATKGDYGHANMGYRGKGANCFGSKGYACTAAGAVIHLFLGVDPNDAWVMAASGTITQDDAVPQWIFKPQDASTDHQNLYYWYYGTLASFQAGGDTWKKWNTNMKTALLPNQCKGGALDGSPLDHDGSWNPDDVWGAWGGRVYSTALSTLCLEVYYRYLKLNGDK
jgi:hypothetical protein